MTGRIQRIEEFGSRMGYPELTAGAGTFLGGGIITDYTNPHHGNLIISPHEAVGYGLSILAAIPVMGLVRYIRDKRAAKQ